jgi:sugar lactone lactonase YvrE
MGQDFHAVRTLTGLDGGFAFDPTQDILYGASTATNQVIAYDAHTWAEKFRLDVGETIGSAGRFDNGVMTVSADGRFLFLSSPSGVRVLTLPVGTGRATHLTISGFPAFISAGTPATFTVTAYDNVGDVVQDFAGTVHFSSSDPAARLPVDFTFTSAYHGTFTFKAILGTGGTQSLTVSDAQDGLSSTQANIQVHAAPTPLIPVPNRRDLVYDPSRDLLYITTSTGTVERYDIATQTLLAPFAIGNSLRGADITPDGNFLYVADYQQNAVQGFVRKVDLRDGRETDLTFDLTFGTTTGALGVAIADNGKGLIATSDYGAPGQGVQEIDLQTDQLTPRYPVYYLGSLRRGADRSLLFGVQYYLGIFTYDAASDSFPHTLNRGQFLLNDLSAVNRNGSLIALDESGPVEIFDTDLNSVHVLNGAYAGVAFDPVRDLLYVADTTSNQIIAYDTATWTQQFRLDIGEAIGAGQEFGNGVMNVSNDGSLLFLSTPSGVRVLNLPGPNGRTLDRNLLATTVGSAAPGVAPPIIRENAPLTPVSRAPNFPAAFAGVPPKAASAAARAGFWDISPRHRHGSGESELIALFASDLPHLEGADTLKDPFTRA